MSARESAAEAGATAEDDVEEGFGQSVVLTARIRSILRGCQFTHPTIPLSLEHIRVHSGATTLSEGGG